MNTTRIGWIGLGNMGIPMAQQLLKAGYPLTVYNRNPEKAKLLQQAGAAIASTPSELTRQSDVIFIMVSDDEATSAVLVDEHGVLQEDSTGKIIVNMSTVSPGINRAMNTFCTKLGCSYLDAPVSGSVKQAETGQLVIMAGGERAVFEQVKPILLHLGKLAMLVGDHGSGNAAKLAINTLLGIHALGLAEATLFALQNNISPADLFTLFEHSALGNIFMKIKGDAILQGNYKAAFALKHIAKDLQLAAMEGLSSPLADTANQVFTEATSTHGEEDIIAVIRHLHKGI